MASPDFSQYIDLKVNDLQPPEAYAAALDYARTAFPEFEPRAGSVEDALLQAFSLINSLYISAANRIPNGTIEGVLRLFGLERREAGVSTINVEFSLLTAGGTVEEGTPITYLVEENGEIVQYPFFVRETVTAGSGQTTVSAVIESLVLGPLPAILIGTPLVISQPSSELLTCVTTSTPSSVSSAETDTEYLTRGVTYLSSLSNSLCTASQIETYILSQYSSVTRCKVYDLAYGSATSPVETTATTNTGGAPNLDVTIDCSDESGTIFSFNTGLGIDLDGSTVWLTTQASFDDATITKTVFPSGLSKTSAGQTIDFDSTLKTISIDGISVPSAPAITDLGQTMVQLVDGLLFTTLNTVSPSARTPDSRGMYVIFVWGPDNHPVPFDVIVSIYDDLNSKTPVGIDAFIHSVMPVDVYAEVEIEVSDGYVSSSVLSEVTDYLNSFFSPNSYPNWTEYVYKNELIVAASQIEGVKRVVSVVLYIPDYGAGDVTAITGSSYSNNELMATLDIANPSSPDFLQFTYAGSMPKLTANATLYGP